MARAKELKIRVEDRPGVLGEVAEALGEGKVNIRAMSAWVEGNEGVARLVVDKLPAARKILTKRGWKPEELDVLEVEVPDRPGALGALAAALGAAGVNITHAFAGSGGARKVTVFLGVSDLKAGAKALR